MAVKTKHQRLTLILLALAMLVAAGLLAMSALKDQAAYFYTPTDAARDGVKLDTPVRLGGMVERGSLVREPDGVSIRFVVTDGARTVPVSFRGIVPDLFREGSGVVAEGRFERTGGFAAETILAKHDERYMPPQIAGDMHKSASLDTAAKPAR